MHYQIKWGWLAVWAVIMNIIGLIALWQQKEVVEGFFLLLVASVVVVVLRGHVKEQDLRQGRIFHEVETPLMTTVRLPHAASSSMLPDSAYYEPAAIRETGSRVDDYTTTE